MSNQTPVIILKLLVSSLLILPCWLLAETHETDVYTVEYPDDWRVERIDRETSRIALYPSDTFTRLQIAARNLDDILMVSQEWLREYTRLDPAIELEYENWGELGGFNYQYEVRLQQRRTWWLTDGRQVLMATFSTSMDDSLDSFQADIERIIRSINLK